MWYNTAFFEDLKFMTLLLQLLLLVLGFVMLVKGADWFVEGCASIATSLGIPQMIVGLTIVAMGTSMPEAAVSIAAASKGTADIAVGNIVGSNIMNILVILGLASVLVPLKIDRQSYRIDMPFMIFITIVLFALGFFDGVLTHIDGIILSIFFLGYLYFLYISAKSNRIDKSERPLGDVKSLLKYLALILIGGTVVVLGSDIAVDAAVEIATLAGLSEKFIGLTIVALGTSLPELATSVTAARKGNADMAVGNVVGSNIFNILFVLGISSLIIPIPFARGFFIDGLTALVSAMVLWGVSLAFKKTGRVTGMVFLAGYGLYLVYLLTQR